MSLRGLPDIRGENREVGDDVAEGVGSSVILLAASCFVHAQGTSITNFTVPYTSYLYDFWKRYPVLRRIFLPKSRGEDLQVENQ